jgi:hypothetical protein
MYKHSYSADGTGVFGKLGIIVTPGFGLRFGATVQTPTSTTIREMWQDYAETTFTDSKFNGNAESDLGRPAEYTFNSPWRFGFGAAYTLGKLAVISADYEVANYGGMKYQYDRHEISDDDAEYFDGVNEDIKASYGAAHYLRLGVEFKPMSVLAVRAGYNLGTQAQKKYYDANLGDYLDIEPTYTQNLSFGVGYSSRKSFFADLAVRKSFLQDEYFMPYDDYMFDEDGNIMVDAYAPEILNKRSLWKVLITFGWRF